MRIVLSTLGEYKMHHLACYEHTEETPTLVIVWECFWPHGRSNLHICEVPTLVLELQRCHSKYPFWRERPCLFQQDDAKPQSLCEQIQVTNRFVTVSKLSPAENILNVRNWKMQSSLISSGYLRNHWHGQQRPNTCSGTIPDCPPPPPRNHETPQPYKGCQHPTGPQGPPRFGKQEEERTTFQGKETSKETLPGEMKTKKHKCTICSRLCI